MIQALVESQAGQVESLELVSQREWNKKLVVIFTFQQRAEGNHLVECLGYAMLERADQDLRITRSYINPCADPPTQITFASERCTRVCVEGWVSEEDTMAYNGR
jgi:hypothetical protein